MGYLNYVVASEFIVVTTAYIRFAKSTVNEYTGIYSFYKLRILLITITHNDAIVKACDQLAMTGFKTVVYDMNCRFKFVIM